MGFIYGENLREMVEVLGKESVAKQPAKLNQLSKHAINQKQSNVNGHWYSLLGYLITLTRNANIQQLKHKSLLETANVTVILKAFIC